MRQGAVTGPPPQQRGKPTATSAEVALFAVSVATIFSFSRLFRGMSFFWPLVAVAAVAHLTGAVARRLNWAAATAALATAVASLVTIVATRYRAGSLLALPTPAVLGRMKADLAAAAEAFRTVVTPVAPRAGFVLGLAGLVTLVAIGADALAFRLRARFEAVVPAGGLFVFAAVLGGPRLRLSSTALFALAVMVFILVDRTRASRQSERWVIGDAERDTRTLVQAGTTIAIATCLVGVGAAAAAVPHPQSSPWTRWRGADDSGTRITVSPLVDLRDRLLHQTNNLMFTVRADRPAYWRITALDDFDNNVWASNNSFGRAAGGLGQRSKPGRSTELRQQFKLVALAQVWAPAAFQPARISGTDQLLYDPESATLIVRRNRNTSDGLAYTIVSDQPVLTPADLTRGGGGMSHKDFAHYTRLPADFPAEVRSTAAQVVDRAGARTEYAKARALQDWFRSDFQYSLDPRLETDHAPPIVAFLHLKRGWCEQFAGTYAAMARSLGLPSRVAIGFTPGRPDPNRPGTFDVFGRQAHAWPEVWFPGQGWVAFEPTPGRGSPGAEQYTGVPPQQDDAATGPPAATPSASGEADPKGKAGTPAQAAPTVPTTLPPAPHPKASRRSDSTAALRVVAWGGVVVAGAALAVFSILALARFCLKRRRWWHARTVAQRVEASWAEACDALSLLDSAPRPAETRLEYARRARSSFSDGPSLDDLAALTTHAVWTDQEPDAELANRASKLAETIDKTVRTEVGWWRYAAGALHPRTLREMARR